MKEPKVPKEHACDKLTSAVLSMTSPRRRLAAPFTTPRAVTVPAAAAAPGVPPSLIVADPSIAEPASDPFYTPPATIPDAPAH